MRYFIKAKRHTLSTGRKVFLKRGGFGHLFLLSYFMLENAELCKKSYKNEDDEAIAQAVEEAKELNANMRCELRHFIDAPVDEMEMPELKESIREAIDFNIPGDDPEDEARVGKKKRKIQSKEEIEELFVTLLARLIEKTGWLDTYLLDNINYVQALDLIDGFDRNRGERVVDAAIAARGDVKEHIDSLSGVRNLTIGEFMREMEKRGAK